MKRLISVIHNNFGKILLLGVLSGIMTSCNSVLNFDEGDCAYQYKIKFKYDYNMKYADAFHSQVKTVTLYAFDDKGNYVTQQTNAGDQLKADDYAMTLSVDPGAYHLVTWAGLDDQSFAVPLLNTSSKLADLTCKTNRETLGSDYNVNHQLASLWHGEMSEATVLSRSRDTILTVPLIKDTNILRIVIVQAADANEVASTSRAIGKNSFKYTLKDNNGFMNYDNTLLSDNLLTYNPYFLGDSVISTRGTDNTSVALKQIVGRATTQENFNAAIAEISTARLLTTQSPTLNITTQDGTISLLPTNSLIKYLALLKETNYSSMAFQEYLDREDHFNMIFFVDKNLQLLNSVIVINNWIIQLNNFDL